MKININFIIYIVLVFIFNNCASIYYPTGGPVDNDHPVIINSENIILNRTNLSYNQPLEFVFNERIHPNTINKIRIEPSTEIKIKHKSNTIVIKPKIKWPDTFRVIFDRSISDYFANSLDAPEIFLFSLSDSLELNNIEGSLFNFNENKIYEVAIVDTNFTIQTKVQSDINGNFLFKGIISQKDFFILAIEDYISDDFKDQIRYQKYGMSNRLISNDYNQIFISEPIKRDQIQSINFINNKYGVINFFHAQDSLHLFLNDTYFSEIPAIKYKIFIDHNFKDSVEIKVKLENRIEEYSISNFLFLENIKDTINPLIKDDIRFYSKIKEDSSSVDVGIIEEEYIFNEINLKLSEPIKILNDGSPFTIFLNDSIYSNTVFEYSSPMEISLFFTAPVVDDTTITDSSFSLNIDCYNIFDLSNNLLCDTLMNVQLSREWKDLKRRKPADPNYVHNIPQGDSYFMGNPNAKVTITKFFDFQ